MGQDAGRSEARVDRALLLGGVPYQYLEEWAITSDFARVERTLGVRVEVVPVEELVARYEGLRDDKRAEAAALARALVGGAAQTDAQQPDDEAMQKATQLHAAIQAIASERGAVAVTTHCGTIRNAAGAVPCVALMLLQDEGIPAACQGDIDALLTMILFKRVAGAVSFMGGGFLENGRLTVSHCVLSRWMAGADAPLQPYYLATYHDRFNSPTVHTDLARGLPVTIARLTCNLEGLLLSTGTLAETRDVRGRCRNTLAIDAPDPARLLAQVRGHQNHLVVALGDHIRRSPMEFLVRLFRALANRRRIAVLRLLCVLGETPVAEIAEATSLGMTIVSGHLALLAGVGLLWRRRSGRTVYYLLAQSPGHPVTAAVLRVLTQIFRNVNAETPKAIVRATRADPTSESDAALFATFTAFTHPRRLQLLRHLALGNSPTRWEASAALSMSPPAALRHIEKLERRGLIRRRKTGRRLEYRLARPGGRPARALLRAVLDEIRTGAP